MEEPPSIPAPKTASEYQAAIAQLLAEMQELFDAAQTRVYGSPPR